VTPAETRRLAAIIAASLLARLPHTMIGLLMVLLMRDTGRSYAIAGIVAGAEVLGGGLGQPLLGRVADRFAPAWTLSISGLASGALFVVIAVHADTLNILIVIGLALLAGVLIPPVSGVVRSQISRTVPRERLASVYALESAALEAAYVLGPVGVVVCVVFISSAATLVVSAVLLVGATLAFVAVARPEAVTHEGPRVAPSQVPGFVGLVTVALVAGAIFGGIELGVTAAMEDAGNRDASGILLAIWAAGSIAGGVAMARRPLGTADRRLPVLLFAGGLLSIPLALVAGSPTLLAIGVLLQGVTVAPSFGALYEIIQRTVPDSALTEAFGWSVAGTLAGFSVGAAVSGPLIELTGPWSAFLVAAVAGLGAGSLALRRV
jgi:MFS family permease